MRQPGLQLTDFVSTVSPAAQVRIVGTSAQTCVVAGACYALSLHPARASPGQAGFRRAAQRGRLVKQGRHTDAHDEADDRQQHDASHEEESVRPGVGRVGVLLGRRHRRWLLCHRMMDSLKRLATEAAQTAGK